jgi:hypothetical protein
VIWTKDAHIVVIYQVNIPGNRKDLSDFGGKKVGHVNVHVLRIVFVVGEQIESCIIGDGLAEI